MRLPSFFTMLVSLSGSGFCIYVQIDDCRTSKSFVNHSLPERPDFYRSIHLQKAHLQGESLSTVIFCMIHEIYTHLKYLEAKLQDPMDDYLCSRPCKRAGTKDRSRKKSHIYHQNEWSYRDFRALMDKILKF